MNGRTKHWGHLNSDVEVRERLMCRQQSAFVGTDIVVGVLYILFYISGVGTAYVEFAISRNCYDFDFDERHLVTVACGGIAVARRQRCVFDKIMASFFRNCNKDFFLRTGGAVTGQTPKEIARTSLRLLSDKDALEKMGDALDAAVPHNAAANILSEMSEAEEEKEEDLA